MKTKAKQPFARTKMKRKDPNRYPKGLNRKKVEAIIEHYEKQTDEEAAAEDEAAYHSATSTMMEIPNKLVPVVQRLITKRAS
jgi:response regulator of citrate/malate metabolism